MRRETQCSVRAFLNAANMRSILLLFALSAWTGFLTDTQVGFAQDAADRGLRAYPYPVRMRIELLSIRNRSCSPVPVQIKLEYNENKILEGDLQLLLFDALDVIGTDGLLATVRLRDIVLSGGDHIFNTVLPPVQTSNVQNLAVQAWFETKSQRIPLSSSLKEVDPPKPHDLLMPSPFERVSLLCSCTGSTVFSDSSANKKFLDRKLSLENYNPMQQEEAEGESVPLPRNNFSSMGRHIQYFSTTWSSRDLPVDPLSYCCFDVVLLCDGALSKLKSEQLEALMIWLRAGGSLCVVPDGVLKPAHLSFLQTVIHRKDDESLPLFLDEDGRLVDEILESGGVRYANLDLGRVVILPAVDNLSAVLGSRELGSIVAWLWKVRRESGVWEGLPWSENGLVESLKRMGIALQRDARGYYIDSQQYGGNQSFRTYVTEESLRQTYGLDDRLAPVRIELIDTAATELLPADVEMVPTWMIGLILVAYVVTIGPVDYFVLGWLRIRKATWVIFPLVTAVFTGLTIAVAHHYMGSTETGGWIEVTDIGDSGKAVRKSRLDMLFYGSRSTHQSRYSNAFASSAAEFVPPSTYASVNDMEEASATRNASTAVQYDGHFPSSFQMTQTIQQWSPQLNRVFELNPENVVTPQIDWTDPSLVTTENGRRQLASSLSQISREPDESWFAVVMHQGGFLDVLRSQVFHDPNAAIPFERRQMMMQYQQYRPSILQSLITATGGGSRVDFFRLVSRVAPQGSGFMEDLLIADSSDPSQWILIVVKQRGNEFQVFRRLYQIEMTPNGAN